MYQNVSHATHPVPQAQYAPEARPYSVKHDFDGVATLTATLTHAISDITGIDVSDVEDALSAAVNLDAFDHLFKPTPDRSNTLPSHFGVHLCGCHVTVYNDGHLVIVPPRPAHPEAGHYPAASGAY